MTDAALHAALEQLADEWEASLPERRTDGAHVKAECMTAIRAILASHPAPERDNHIRAEAFDETRAFVVGVNKPSRTAIVKWLRNAARIARDTSPPTTDGDTHD